MPEKSVPPSDQLSKVASLHGERATLLSQMFEAVEYELDRLPSNVAVEVEGDGVTLARKRTSSGWRLAICTTKQDYQITSAPLALKVHAAKLVPKLLSAIAERQTMQLAEIEEGVEALHRSLCMLSDLNGGAE